MSFATLESLTYHANYQGKRDRGPAPPDPSHAVVPSRQSPPVPGRTQHTAIWTGTKMLVWGGDQWFDSVHGEQRTDGASYDPASNEWEVMTNAGAPAQRDAHTSIWTGTVMIVWGGRQWRGGGVPAFLADGGIYEPATDSWRPISSIGAPSERGWHSAVWTGTEMLVWGGLSTTSDGAGHVETHQDGFAYDPVVDRWRPLSTVGAPSKRTEHSAVWTGAKMIVWGGFGEGDRADGGIYDPKTDTWQRMESAPFARGEHFAFWTGSRMLVYGGNTTESEIPSRVGRSSRRDRLQRVSLVGK